MSFTDDTVIHVNEVRSTLENLARILNYRGRYHDLSKFRDKEWSIFSKVLDNKKSAEYGTPEYEEIKRELAPALEHHYKENRHHPEHFANGVTDMDLIDLLEMLADWKSATNRHQKDSMLKNIDFNCKRYHIEGQLKSILENTIKNYLEV